MSTFEEIDLFSEEYNILFENADSYKKTTIVEAYKAEKEIDVDTIIKRDNSEIFVETKNTAHIGDYIVEGIEGEKYVVSKDEFETLYTEIEPGKYIKERVVKAVQINKNIIFKTTWGTEKLLVGGWLVESQFGRYGVDGEVFEETYKKW